MARGLHQYSVQEAKNAKLGQGGMDYIEGAATINQTTNPGVTWVAITALDTDATTVSATSVDTAIWDTLSSVEVPAGTTIYGRWSIVTIGGSDFAVAYRG
jgi:hypothetical protein